MKWFKASRKSKSDLFFDVVIYGFAILLILLIVYPLWFVVIASFSNPSDVANGKVWFIPHEWKLDGYLRLIEQPLFLRSYLNTILYTVVGTLIALLINIPAGYALSRRDLLGKKVAQRSLHCSDVRIRWIDSNLLNSEECRTCRYILGNGCSICSIFLQHHRCKNILQ